MRLPTCSQHSRLAFSRIFNATATTVIYTLSLHDALPISALQLGGGVVKVHDDILCTFTSLEGAANQVLTRLNQNLDGDIFWNQRSEEHTSELQSRGHLVCRLLLEKKKLILDCDIKSVV